MSIRWNDVASALGDLAATECSTLDAGQRETLGWIGRRLPSGGIVLADEVGTGKTRIACAVAREVIARGGRVAIVVPQGLMHQWDAEWKSLGGHGAGPGVAAPKQLTTFRAFVRGLEQQASVGAHGDIDREEAALGDLLSSRCPRPQAPEAWLISHTMRAPAVRVAERYPHRPWWLALPTLVRAELQTGDAGFDGRTKFGRLDRKLHELRQSANHLEWQAVASIARDVAARIDGRSSRAKDLADLELLDLRKDADNRELAEAFRKDGPAQIAFEWLIGSWLGEFDLVIIDEAHKSRGHAGDLAPLEEGRAVSATMLTRLLERLVVSAPGSRRIGMTATPLELRASQWDTLLRRTLAGPARLELDALVQPAVEAAERLEWVATGVHRALRAGATELAEHDVERLCAASEDVTRVLGTFVTRRRRSSEELHLRFRDALIESRGEAAPALSSRPHRRVRPSTVDPFAATRANAGGPSDDASSAPVGPTGRTSDRARSWGDALFAMESLAMSLRGYVVAAVPDDDPRDGRADHVLRSAYTRLAGGHIDADATKMLREFTESLPPPGESNGRRRHLDRIRYWVRQETDALSRLSVDSARNDRGVDVLASHPRVRRAVEVIEEQTDCGEKVLVFGTYRRPMHVLREVLEARAMLRLLRAGKPVPAGAPGIVRLAFDELVHHPSPAFDGCAGTPPTLDALMRAVDSAKREYELWRSRVAVRIEHAVRVLLAEGGLETAAEGHADALAKLFWPTVVDEFLYSTHSEAVNELSDDDVAELVRGCWKREIAADVTEDSQGVPGDDGDTRRGERLARLLEKLESEVQTKHDTHFVRELTGDTDLTTRRHLQARFNRHGLAPRVLLAQSQVGREGLNLHESCRVVVQFNAEWNPAILEQQVGRVDRKGSLWERLAKEWLDGDRAGEPPMIEVIQIVLAGTYDQFHWETVAERQHVFDATLFGDLLPTDRLGLLDESTRRRLAEAAPDFAPTRGNGGGRHS